MLTEIFGKVLCAKDLLNSGGPAGGSSPRGLSPPIGKLNMVCTDVQGISERGNAGQIVARMASAFSKISSQKLRFLAILSTDFGEKLADSR